MEIKNLSPKGITANLLPELDRYVRRSAKRRNVSMNQIVNEAIWFYMSNGGARNGK